MKECLGVFPCCAAVFCFAIASLFSRKVEKRGVSGRGAGSARGAWARLENARPLLALLNHLFTPLVLDGVKHNRGADERHVFHEAHKLLGALAVGLQAQDLERLPAHPRRRGGIGVHVPKVVHHNVVEHQQSYENNVAQLRQIRHPESPAPAVLKID